MAHGVGVVEHVVGEVSLRGVLRRTHLNHHFHTGKNVKGGHSA